MIILIQDKSLHIFLQFSIFILHKTLIWWFGKSFFRWKIEVSSNVNEHPSLISVNKHYIVHPLYHPLYRTPKTQPPKTLKMTKASQTQSYLTVVCVWRCVIDDCLSLVSIHYMITLWYLVWTNNSWNKRHMHIYSHTRTPRTRIHIYTNPSRS